MPQFPQRDLTNQFISTSYQDVVQRYATTGSNTYLLDGLGYVIIGVPNTSIGNNVVTQDVPASSSISASYSNVSDASTISISSSYSLDSEYSNTASISIISQYSLQAYTASYILGNEVDGPVISSSYALSASYVPVISVNPSSSWASSSISSSYALSASYVPVISVNPSSSWASSSISSSYSLTASYALNGSGDGSSTSSSWASSSISSSYSLTASYALNGGGSSLITGSTYPITSSWSISSSIVPFNGNRSIKRSGYSGLNVGGYDVDTFLNNFFFPFIPATVSISGGGTYETGSVQNISVVSTITVNDETLFGTASVFRNSVLWNTDSSIPPYTFTFTDNSVSSSQTYQTFVQTNNDGSPTVISSGTTTVSFLYPYLWGLSATSGLSGTSLYNAFTPQITGQGNKTISLNGSAVYIYFAYPSSYPDLTSILDPNLFQVISSFNESIVSVTSTGLTNNWTTNYKVYQTQLVSSPNGNFQFIY